MLRVIVLFNACYVFSLFIQCHGKRLGNASTKFNSVHNNNEPCSFSSIHQIFCHNKFRNLNQYSYDTSNTTSSIKEQQYIENAYLITFKIQSSTLQEFDTILENILSKCKTTQLLHVYKHGINAIAITNVSHYDLEIILNEPEVLYAERVSLLFFLIQI